MFWKYYC